VGEGALHRVHGDPLEVIECPAEGVGALGELAGHRRVAHQPIVGVQRHAEAQAAQHADGVLGNRLAHARVHVGSGAELERHSSVAHELGETPEHLVTRHAADVVDDANAVPQSFGAAELQRLPNRRQSECLASVNGGVEVGALDELERIEMSGRWVARFGAGDVEADHAFVAELDGEFGDFLAACRGAHRRENRVDGEVGPGRAAAEAGEHRAHDLIERESCFGVQLWRESHLGVDHVVGGEILRALERDPLDGVAMLHHADGVRERLEIEDEVVAFGAAVKPLLQVGHVGGGQISVAELARQLDHCLGAQTPVEVVVEQCLRRRMQCLVPRHLRRRHTEILRMRGRLSSLV